MLTFNISIYNNFVFDLNFNNLGLDMSCEILEREREREREREKRERDAVHA